MFGNRKKSGDVGHIKPSTQGTSNEISFSVLHAKSNAAAQDQGSPARPAWELPQEELNARRTKRRRGRRLMAAAITLAVAAIVVVVASIVVVNVQRQLDHVAYTKSVLQKVLDECDQLQPFNDSINDALVQNIGTKSYSDLESNYKTAQTQSSQHDKRLHDLKSEIEDAQQYLTLPADKEAANQGLAAINAQLNLIQMAASDMEFALPAQKAYSDAESAVGDILHANDLAREATELTSNINAENAAASKAKSEECLAALQTASEKLNSVQNEVLTLSNAVESTDSQSSTGSSEDENKQQPEASAEDKSEQQPEALTDNQNEQQPETPADPDAVVSTYIEYVNLRIKAQESAIASMQAYIDRDKTTLQQANDTYNQLETQAASLMAEQTLLPSDDVSAAFNKARTPYVDQWNSELARVTVACSAIRDYLS
ncbi:hypothetical protein [Adlercreutzia sp. ZJ154]|uniref:hypothetical protein n=1 Tax=Adlercreutzia sp. ZJ154 TaxID=2709790 RepID=UPI0013EA42AB|nr:hypothetical protein [Adlercreutzia sp. ZJ154]